jgi:hypothetical protein
MVDDMLKESIIPKLIYRCNAINIKIPTGFFIDMDKMILKFICKCVETSIDKASSEKKYSWGNPTY